MSDVLNRLKEFTESLKQSVEYQTYIQAKMEVDADEELKNIVYNFKKQQFSLQTDRLAGKTVDEDRLKGLQSIYTSFMLNPIISKFLQAELELTNLMSEVYKTIQEEVPIDVSFLK